MKGRSMTGAGIHREIRRTLRVAAILKPIVEKAQGGAAVFVLGQARRVAASYSRENPTRNPSLAHDNNDSYYAVDRGLSVLCQQCSESDSEFLRAWYEQCYEEHEQLDEKEMWRLEEIICLLDLFSPDEPTWVFKESMRIARGVLEARKASSVDVRGMRSLLMEHDCLNDYEEMVEALRTGRHPHKIPREERGGRRID